MAAACWLLHSALGAPGVTFAFGQRIRLPWHGSAVSFLTTDSNDVVKPIDAKAMPVLLTTPEEWDIMANSRSKVAFSELDHEKLRVASALNAEQRFCGPLRAEYLAPIF